MYMQNVYVRKCIDKITGKFLSVYDKITGKFLSVYDKITGKFLSVYDKITGVAEEEGK